jgi:DNA-binding HxlR family transcriptional regulator
VLVTAAKKVRQGNGPRRLNPVDGCPLTAAVAALGGKWKLIIVYWLAESPRHFAALHQLIPGISSKVLTEDLRELETDGIVDRTPTGPIPAPVVYSLSAYGGSGLPLVESMRLWGRGHLEQAQAGRPAR